MRGFCLSATAGLCLWAAIVVPVFSNANKTQLITDLTASLTSILEQKSKQWANSGLLVGFRHQNQTLQLAAGYNDMVTEPPLPK